MNKSFFFMNKTLVKVVVVLCMIMITVGCSDSESEEQIADAESSVIVLDEESEIEESRVSSVIDEEESNLPTGTQEEEIPLFFTDCLSNIENQRTVDSSYITERYVYDNHYYIDENGSLWGKGRNTYAQLGIDNPEDINDFGKQYEEPVWIADNVIHVDASQNGYFVIYITEDHQLYGLGQNTYGVLRQEYVDDEENRPWLNVVWDPVLLMENVMFASAGRDSIAVLTDNNEVYWWGRFQASTGTARSGLMESWEPKLMVSKARYVVCSGNSAAAIDQNNNLWLWGCNVWGQCGQEGADYIEEPIQVTDKVEMVWAEDFSSRKAAYERDGDPLEYQTLLDCSYAYTTIIRKNGGDYYACGIDLGENEKTAQLHGGLMYPGVDAAYHTHNYSSEFLKIQVAEIEEAGIEDNETE